jgi:hypothetical protein
MIRSSDLLIFFEKTNFSNRFSIRFFINSSYHLNFYHCNASSIYLSTKTKRKLSWENEQISYEILKSNSFIQKQDENFFERMKEQISYEILKLNFFIQEQNENFLEKMNEQISYEMLKLNIYFKTRRKFS